jgi:hypothetical protein
LIVVPEPAEAPVIFPVIVPIVQAKLLGAVAVRTILGAVALQILAVAELLTTGVGFTVTVIVKAAPEQDPEVEVGVTKYCTVPAVALLGLVNI